MLPVDIVYFSNYSGNTKRFVEKLDGNITRIPIHWDSASPTLASRRFVLFVPTYGGGSQTASIPRSVRQFLNIEHNRNLLVGVVGFGNTNFGEHFCKAAEMICEKTGVPLIGRIEIFGTDEDVQMIKERLGSLYDSK